MAAPPFSSSSLGGEICAEEKVADLGSIGFPRRVCVPDYCLGPRTSTRALPAPPLGQGHLSPGDMSLFKFGTWHSQNLSNRLSSASQKFNLSNDVYVLRCTHGMTDQLNLIWLNLYS